MKARICMISAIAVFVLFAGLYAVTCWFMLGLWAIAVWVAMIAAIPLSSLLHELGHMLFGAISGIKTKPHFNLFGSSSCALMPKKENKIKNRAIVTAFGGIAVNIIICAVCVGLISLGIAPVWLSFLVPANMYLLILNAFPVHYSSGKTDMLVIDEIVKNSDEGKVLLAVLTVQAQLLNGKPMEEVDEKLLFDLPQIREDDQSFIALTELRYEYMKAKGNEEEAQKYRQRFEQLKEEYM